MAVPQGDMSFSDIAELESYVTMSYSDVVEVHA
jgi:hypothetical protein